ncbi:DUF6415 family natural product biosynthesis protein [Streptomyces sp. NPDC021100]|uniref:DUF6415 family natural product biosynthesis protein n=1 Tax=Streptomyces sp. NPDC021100 TaxID=3365114 RepID=UPI0037B0F6F6
MPTATHARARQYYSARTDDPEGSAPLDVEGIQQTIATALDPVPQGADLVPEALALTARMLSGHVALLLPPAEAEHRSRRPDPRSPGLTGYGLRIIRHQLDHEPCPDPQTDASAAHAWIQQRARWCRMLLGLAVADGRELQHAAVRQ